MIAGSHEKRPPSHKRHQRLQRPHEAHHPQHAEDPREPREAQHAQDAQVAAGRGGDPWGLVHPQKCRGFWEIEQKSRRIFWKTHGKSIGLAENLGEIWMIHGKSIGRSKIYENMGWIMGRSMKKWMDKICGRWERWKPWVALWSFVTVCCWTLPFSSFI